MSGLRRLPPYWINNAVDLSEVASLSVTILSSRPDLYEPEVLTLLVPLFGQAHRWKDFTTFHAFLPRTSPYLYSQMQALDSLTFIVIGGQGIVYPEIHPDDSAILPNVQEFSVKYPQINDFPQLLPFALTNGESSVW